LSASLPGGEHHDAARRVHALRPNRPAQRDAVQAGDHDVEDDDVELLGARAFEGGGAFRDLFNVETCERQMQTKQLPDRRLVFDNQDPAFDRSGRDGRHGQMSPV
jgi:hypothetical protein